MHPVEWVIVAVVVVGLLAAVFGWDRYRSLGRSEGPGPLVPRLAPFVLLAPGSQEVSRPLTGEKQPFTGGHQPLIGN